MAYTPRMLLIRGLAHLSATTYAPETWWNPLEPFSVMTCVMQWGVAIVGLIAINRWLARRLAG